MRKQIVTGIVFYLFIFTAQAQDKPVLAVMPFTSAQVENRSVASQVQEITIDILRSKSNIEIVDRSKDTLVLTELNNQIREVSMSSKVLVQQGVLSGAQQVLAGTITGVSVEARQPSSILGSVMGTKYICNLSYSLQVIDVATGKTVFSESFSGNTKKQDKIVDVLGNTTSGKAATLLMADTKEEAITKAIKASRNDITEWASKTYPTSIKFLSIESKTKKGQPENVAVAGIDKNMGTGTSIIINEITYLDDGSGNKLKRSKKACELKVAELQGDITICKVTDGAGEIERLMKGGVILEVNIK